MLIDFDGTHNFINYKLAKFLNGFVYIAPEFQVMIADGGTIKSSGKCHNINMVMVEYLLNSPMIAIPMGGFDVVLGVQWLQSLGTVAFNFQKLFMKFSWEGKEYELNGRSREKFWRSPQISKGLLISIPRYLNIFPKYFHLFETLIMLST